MKLFFSNQITREIALSFFGLCLIAVSGGYLTSIYIVSEETNSALDARLETTTLTYNKLLKSKAMEADTLKTELGSEKENSRALVGQVGNLHQAVDVLQKYAKTDKQLLEKYSKVYFLNENYKPESLTPIDSEYVSAKDKTIEFHTSAYPMLRRLIQESRSTDVHLLVASAYRSFGTQTSLKSSYKRTFGTTAANSFSADQGYSEHQLGTAVDFTTPAIGLGLSGFEKTTEYLWLTNNAYRYGFILSYPSSNSYYTFEPWHWRFVGIALATRLHNEHKTFYDMDQRDINEYLIRLFDQY